MDVVTPCSKSGQIIVEEADAKRWRIPSTYRTVATDSRIVWLVNEATSGSCGQNRPNGLRRSTDGPYRAERRGTCLPCVSQVPSNQTNIVRNVSDFNEHTRHLEQTRLKCRTGEIWLIDSVIHQRGLYSLCCGGKALMYKLIFSFAKINRHK